MALLYRSSCAARLALVELLVEVGEEERDCFLARDRASSRTSDQRETKSPLPNAEGETSLAS